MYGEDRRKTTETESIREKMMIMQKKSEILLEDDNVYVVKMRMMVSEIEIHW